MLWMNLANATLKVLRQRNLKKIKLRDKIILIGLNA